MRSGSSVKSRAAAPARQAVPRLSETIGAYPSRPLAVQIGIGVLAALIAICIRYSLPLQPIQIPTLTVVIALALVTTFVGIVAGITTAVTGGVLACYLFFDVPFSWSLANGAWVPALAYVVIATVIVTTSYLYRSSEQARHERDVALLRNEAETANLFAREMAHRLKNALTIVQSIAFQTIGVETAEAGKFAGRLKALADANELLTEHVEMPTAKVAQVIGAAVKPFGGVGSRIRLDSVDAAIPAQQVVSLALAIHELATNASKYGALAAPDGWVEIRVEDKGERLEVRWAEHDGPPVVTPEAQGFGTRLLRRAGMNAKLDFAPDGVRCSIRIHKTA